MWDDVRYNPRTGENEFVPPPGSYDHSISKSQEKELLKQIKILTETIMTLTKEIKNLTRRIK